MDQGKRICCEVNSLFCYIYIIVNNSDILYSSPGSAVDVHPGFCYIYYGFRFKISFLLRV